MNSLESANIRPLNPDNPRSSDTVHPGSSNLSDFVEGPLPDDDLNLDIPLDVSINSPPRDQLREADTEYPFRSPMPDQPSTPLPNRAVQKLLDQDGIMASPLSSPPIVANDEVLGPLSEKIEPTQWESQQEFAEVNGVPTDDTGVYSPPIETGISDSTEAVDQDYFSPRSDDVRDELIDPMGDTRTPPSVKELIDGLAISEEKEGEARKMDTSYPTPEEFSSDDESDMPTELVSPLTPPLSLEPQPDDLYSDDDEDSPNTSPDSPNLSLPSQGSTYEIKVHVSDRGTTSILEAKRTSNGDIGVSE